MFNKVKLSLNTLGALGFLGRFGAKTGATIVNAVREHTAGRAVGRHDARRMSNRARSATAARSPIPLVTKVITGTIFLHDCSRAFFLTFTCTRRVITVVRGHLTRKVKIA
jgi:hypothetical protein